MLTRDRRLLGLCVGFSITTFINTAIVLDNAILYGAEMGHLNNDTLVLNDALCVLNLLLCGYASWVAYTGLRPARSHSRRKRSRPYRLHMSGCCCPPAMRACT